MLSEVIPTQVGCGGGLVTNGAVMFEELAVACPGVANPFGAHALGCGIPRRTARSPSRWRCRRWPRRTAPTSRCG